jgi:MFS family permease
VSDGLPASVETRQSWIVATAALVVLSLSFGSTYISAVALKPIAADLGGARSVPALAGALAYFGAGIGGIVMGLLAEKVGVRTTVIIGGLSIAVGLLLSAGGSAWQLYLGHGLFIGLLGNGAIFPPLMTAVSHWFDRRRGTALALISSGQYIAGAIWPPLFEATVSSVGWRATMAGFAALVAIVVVPVAALFVRTAPAARAGADLAPDGTGAARRFTFPILCLASALCCIPMAMPLAHLVAFCTDLGISSGRSALMLTVLLGAAFLSRQLWGYVADRIGGLRTLLAGSVCQGLAMAGFLVVRGDLGLLLLSAGFGLGFAGLIPAYIVAIRELFPAREAGWRVPTLLFVSLSAMGFGGWIAGALFDLTLSYAPAFALGTASNLLHFGAIALLIAMQRRPGQPEPESAFLYTAERAR